MFVIGFNIILPSAVAGFKDFDFHSVFILKFLLGYFTTRSAKIFFFYFLSLRMFVETSYKNIATENK